MNTPTMPKVPAGLGQIPTTPAAREVIVSKALDLGLDLNGESAEQIQLMIDGADPEFTAEQIERVNWETANCDDVEALIAAASDTPDLDIDAVIKDVGLQVDTDDQWIDIGLSCLDQANVSLRDQDRILAIIQGRA